MRSFGSTNQITCIARGGVGTPCYGEDEMCTGDSLCSGDGVCATKVGRGGSCDKSSRCSKDLHCMAESDGGIVPAMSGRCQPFDDGDRCYYGGECGPLSRCIGRSDRSDGCEFDDTDGGPRCAPQEPIAGKCQRVTGVNGGGACDSEATICKASYYCDGETGRCKNRLADGDSCAPQTAPCGLFSMCTEKKVCARGGLFSLAMQLAGRDEVPITAVTK